MGVSAEVFQLYAFYKKPYLYYKSRENPYQILQVTCTQNVYEMKILAVF